MNIRDKNDLIEEIKKKKKKKYLKKKKQFKKKKKKKKKKKLFEKRKISTRERHFLYQFSLQIWNQDSRNLVC